MFLIVNNLKNYYLFIEMETNEATNTPSTDSKSTAPPVRLVDIPISDDNVAFNLMVSFLNLAQKRGAFSIDESAKIWECIKRFQPKT